MKLYNVLGVLSLLCVLFHLCIGQDLTKDQYVTKHEEDVQICLNKNEPLQLKDPFPIESINGSNFISMRWDRYHIDDERDEILVWSLGDTVGETKLDDFEVYQNWGIKKEKPRVNDSARYEALFFSLREADRIRHIYHVVVAEAPLLKSHQLNVTRMLDKATGIVTLTCGTLASLGSPPITLIWRAPDGRLLNGDYKDGNLTLNITQEEATAMAASSIKGPKNWWLGPSLSKAKGITEKEGKFSCEIAEPSVAADCILDKDIARWEGTFVYPQKKTASSSLGLIIMIVLMCVVGLLAIFIISLLLYKRSREGHSYSTAIRSQVEEAEMLEGMETAQPGVTEDARMQGWSTEL